jgi:N-acyl homoserine lactone hydrolase
MTTTTRLHVLSGGRLRMRLSTYLPAADRAEMVEVPCPCFLVRHPQGNVLFDTGCHPSVATDAEARWGGVAKSITPVLAPGESVLTELASPYGPLRMQCVLQASQLRCPCAGTEDRR